MARANQNPLLFDEHDRARAQQTAPGTIPSYPYGQGPPLNNSFIGSPPNINDPSGYSMAYNPALIDPNNRSVMYQQSESFPLVYPDPNTLAPAPDFQPPPNSVVLPRAPLGRTPYSRVLGPMTMPVPSPNVQPYPNGVPPMTGLYGGVPIIGQPILPSQYDPSYGAMMNRGPPPPPPLSGTHPDLSKLPPPRQQGDQRLPRVSRKLRRFERYYLDRYHNSDPFVMTCFGRRVNADSRRNRNKWYK